MGTLVVKRLIKESKNCTKALSDLKPCIQIFEKFDMVPFSLSPRKSSLLSAMYSLNVTLQHIKGSGNILSDYLTLIWVGGNFTPPPPPFPVPVGFPSITQKW